MKNKTKNFLKSLAAVALSATMLTGLAACAPGSGGDNEDPGKITEPEKKDYTVTFHYGLAAGATLDANGKASAYSAKEEMISKEGRKITMTTALQNKFNVDGYKIIGYSTDAWKTNGITADMDVYVYYAVLENYTVTFKNPDGSVIKTITISEADELTEEMYPTSSEVTTSEGLKHVGWDNKTIGKLTGNIVITAKQGTTLRLEAENAQLIEYVGADESYASPTISATGSGGKSVYMFDNAALPYSVAVEYTVWAEEARDLDLSLGMWFRAGGSFSLKNRISAKVKNGDAEYIELPMEASLECTNAWGDFRSAEVGEIHLAAGYNYLRFEGASKLYANLDYIELSGDVEGVELYIPRHTLTLQDASFADGGTTAELKEGSGLPKTVVGMEEGYYIEKWVNVNDETQFWKPENFVMPGEDITIRPVVVKGLEKEYTVANATAIGSRLSRNVTATVKASGNKFFDDSGNNGEFWAEWTITSNKRIEGVKLSLTYFVRNGNAPAGSLADYFVLTYKYSGETEYRAYDLSQYPVDISKKANNAWNDTDFVTSDMGAITLEEGATSIRLQARNEFENIAHPEWYGTNLRKLTLTGDLSESAQASQLAAAAEAPVVDGVKDGGYTQIGSLAHRVLAERNGISSGDYTNDAASWATATAYGDSRLDATVHAAVKDGKMYFYVEVTGKPVYSRGKAFVNAETGLHQNDGIELWFSVDEVPYRIMVDAFGYRAVTLANGVALAFPYMDEVSYVTKLIGDENLASYKESGAAVSSNATGYIVELCIPLKDAQGNVCPAGTMVTWALQVDVYEETVSTLFAAFGRQLKTESQAKDFVTNEKFVIG